MRRSVYLPGSLVADCGSLLQKTIKIGQVARALAIFRIQHVGIYDDSHPSCKQDTPLIVKLLRYAETPQYLRKLLFPKDADLRYVGLLPPLRTPHHPLRGEREEVGAVREALVLEQKREGSILELGLPKKGLCKDRLRRNQRVTVKLVKGSGRFYEVVPCPPDDYWGFSISTHGSLRQALRAASGLRVATSRYGRHIRAQDELVEQANRQGFSLFFGGPYWGILETSRKQGVPSSLFDDVVNVIPKQGTATVRTEEALFCALALFHLG